MSLSLSGRLRRRLAEMLWPHAFEPPPPPKELYGLTYCADGLMTQHNSDFLDDPRFRRAYAAGKATGSWWDHDLQWRAYVICWAAERGAALDGDFVECGVHRGGYSRMLADYVDLAAMPDKRLYLVDTYCGLPERFRSEGQEEMLAGLYGDSDEEVVRTFAPFANAVVVRGIVPEVLPAVPTERVCYLSIDLNSVAPSIAAAEHFWPRMSRGAAMVLDDYGFPQFADQKPAFDALAAGTGVPILALPTGQGLLIKP